VTTVPMPAEEMTVGRQGHYAGAVSRLVAFAVDVGVLWGLYLLWQFLINKAVTLITGHSYSIDLHRIAALVILVVWGLLYFAYQWAVSGKTLGMAILGVQVVTVEGGPIAFRQAILRTIGLGLCLLTLGIGFLGIVFQRERRALDDYVARTAVVYDWDARAARLRWLARKEGTAHHGLSHQRSLVPPPPRQTPRPSELPTTPPEHVPT
jgi:uncharacterized RDD family membrane protein YckC